MALHGATGPTLTANDPAPLELVLLRAIAADPEVCLRLIEGGAS